MSIADDTAYMSVAEMTRRIRQRDFSPVEVVDAAIARIEARDPSLNAFVFRGFDDARQAAERAEKALLAGETIGLLHGVPTAIKDLYDFKPGWPYTFGGVRAMKDCIAHWYCPFAESVERAGAIVLGKTNSPSMGLRGTCDNYMFGPTRNPFELCKNSGGSSGGSAAAVADGLVPFAEGTDAGGSIRIPAAWCGVVGYFPSFGRVPSVIRPNAFGAAMPFMAEGPITRTVEDAALVLNTLAGIDPRDPFSIPTDEDFVAATYRSIKGWRIAYSPDYDVFPIAAEVRTAIDKAVAAFAEAGAIVETVKLGLKRSQRELSDAWGQLIAVPNVAAIDGLKAAGIDMLAEEHRSDLPPEYLHWLGIGHKLTVRDIIQTQAIRSEVYDAIEAVLAKHEIFVSPTLACMPVDNAADGNTVGPSSIEGVEVDPLIGWCLTYLTNFTGHPSCSVPAELSNGLPVGMHLVGRRQADGDVLAAAAAFERLRPWHDDYRRCSARAI